MPKKPITFDSFIRTAAVILGLVLIILLIDYLSVVLVPFFVAWFVAYLIFPLVSFFEHKAHFHYRIPSIIAALLVVCSVVGLLIYLTVPKMVDEFSHFTTIVNHYLHSAHYDTQLEQVIAEYLGQIDFTRMLHSGQLFNILKTVMPGVWNIFQQTAAVVVSIVSWAVSVLYLFFILYDFENLSQGVKKLIPRKYSAFANTLFSDLNRGMNAYFRGQFLIAVCVGVLFCIGFSIINFPLAIPLGILIGALSFIPYLHALGLIPAFFLCILKSAETGQNFWLVLLSAAAVFAIVQMIQDGILTPKIMGSAIGLPPFSILLSLSVWGYLLGIIGMIIALPLTTILFSYYKRYIVKTE